MPWYIELILHAAFVYTLVAIFDALSNSTAKKTAKAVIKELRPLSDSEKQVTELKTLLEVTDANNASITETLQRKEAHIKALQGQLERIKHLADNLTSIAVEDEIPF